MDPTSAEISKQIVVPIVRHLLAFVKQQLGYIIFYKKKVENMRNLIDGLKGKIAMVQDQVEADKINSVEIQSDVTTWLENVEKISEKAEKISVDCDDAVSRGCLNLKQRYSLGKGASKELQLIKDHIKAELNIILSKNQRAPGKVCAGQLPSMVQMDGFAVYDSRTEVYCNVSEALRDDKKRMIAIWGMGGVGKTTMVEQLEKTAREKHWFDWILKAVVTAQPNVYDIQQAIADGMKLDFDVRSVGSRAERLAKAFKELSEEGRKKILVILDDVWEVLDLKQVGLSPIAFASASFKIIFTTRNKHVYTGMKVENSIIFELGVLVHEEALDLFNKTVEMDNFTDPELPKIAENIVRECAGLPLAITTVAGMLKATSKSVWKDTLERLSQSQLDGELNRVLAVSFNNLKNEDVEEIFLLSCLFPEDYDIPIEELARYAMGLRLYKGIYNMAKVRTRTEACIEKLRSVNLLLDSEYEDCIKMHDIVRDFGLNHATSSNNERMWLVNHSDIEQWPQQDSYERYTRISLECSHMYMLPAKLKCSNLELLKLKGKRSLEFPKDFYEGMENLRVLDHQEMNNPLLPGGSFQSFSNLRTLSLRSCNLGDLSMIGNLEKLEVLSLAGCGGCELHTEIGKLSQLKLLDITGCKNLRIEDGALQRLVNLEELYMRSAYSVYKFSDSNRAALGARFESLTALEFEFCENGVEARPIFFKKLTRFRISIGCHLDGKDSWGHLPFKNTLMLKTNAIELRECGICELFKMTEVLVFQVDNMNSICDVSNPKDFSNLKILRVEGCKELICLIDTEVMCRSPPLQQSLFRMLKVLEVFACNKLKFVFPHSVVQGMSMLERLEVSSCENMEEIMEYESGNKEEDIAATVVVFHNLRLLSLKQVPNLVSFCKTVVGAIQFPQLEKFKINGLQKVTNFFQEAERVTPSAAATDQSKMHQFFSQKVALPKLQLLNIEKMENLREIWPSQCRREDVNLCTITRMRVWYCDNLVNLFPTNVIPKLHHLELWRCKALEVIYDLNFGNGYNNNNTHCCEIEEEEEGCSCLREIYVSDCRSLMYVWKMAGVNSDQIIQQFKRLRSITIWGCRNVIHLFTPSTASINLGGLESINMKKCKPFGSRSHDLLVADSSTNGQKESQAIAFPSYLLQRFCKLEKLFLYQCEAVDVAFEIGELSGEFATGSQQVLLPQLRELTLERLRNMSHVWKLNRLNLHQPPLRVVGFQNLTSVYVRECNKIKYLFSLLMAKHLVRLQSVTLYYCEEMQTIVLDVEDDDDQGCQEIEEISIKSHTKATLFPQLQSLSLSELPNLMRIGGCGTNATRSKLQIVDAGSLSRKSCTDLEGIEHAQVVSFADLTKLSINGCRKLLHAFPFYAAGQLHKLEFLYIYDCKKMVELFEMEEINSKSYFTEERSHESMTIPRPTLIDLYQLSKLTKMTIKSCDGLICLFTSSTVRSLKQLKTLEITSCSKLEVIVKEDDREHSTSTTDVVRFSSLQCFTLENLQHLKAFSVGVNEFEWPLLDEVKIVNCPRMTMFTCGKSTTPQLKYIYTSLGKHHVEGRLNFKATTTPHQTDRVSSSDSTYMRCISENTEQLQFPWSLSNLIEADLSWEDDLLHIFTLNESSKLQQLEKIRIDRCDSLVVVFEVLDGTNNDMHERQSVVKFPKLREMSLERLRELKYICKSQKWTVLEFTNLTKLSFKQCGLLDHVFTYSTVGSFVHLQQLEISGCEKMEVIVKEAYEEEEEKEDSEGVEDKAIVFAHLKSLKLEKLPSLKGFCLRKYAFKWPSLDTLVIKRCPKITVFTSGNSSTPKLKLIDTDFGLCYVKEDPNSFITRKKQQGFELYND